MKKQKGVLFMKHRVLAMTWHVVRTAMKRAYVMIAIVHGVLRPS